MKGPTVTLSIKTISIPTRRVPKPHFANKHWTNSPEIISCQPSFFHIPQNALRSQRQASPWHVAAAAAPWRSVPRPAAPNAWPELLQTFPRHPLPPPEVRYFGPQKHTKNIPKTPNLRRYDWMSRVYFLHQIFGAGKSLHRPKSPKPWKIKVLVT